MPASQVDPSSSADATANKTRRLQLRRQLRARRRALSTNQQALAARRLQRLLCRQPVFWRSRHLALYLPNDGEIDPRPLLLAALALGKTCYLPVLRGANYNSLYFVRFRPDTPLQRNRFGIPEPRTGGRRLAPALLDLVLMPLVGFDRRGGRLGMGGGFYDRTFAFRQRRASHKPVLLGLAHSCQEVDALPVAAWDIPLDAIVTEHQIIPCRAASAARDFISLPD